jgi:hypothetical protein
MPRPFLFSLLLLACFGSQADAADPAFKISLRGRPAWKSLKDVRADLGPDVLISGKTVDLRGAIITGKFLKHPRNSQDEASVGVRIHIKGLTLKNGFIEDIPGGLIAMAPDVTLQSLTFTRAGEDFVSNEKDRSPGFRVLGCRFFNNKNGDKSIQANDARGLVVSGNLIFGGTTALRIQKKNAKRQGGTAIVEANTFQEVSTAVNAAGSVTILLRANAFKNVRTKITRDGDQVQVVQGRK